MSWKIKYSNYDVLMQCPHCLVHIEPTFNENQIGNYGADTLRNFIWRSSFAICPSCKEEIIRLEKIDHQGILIWEILGYPKNTFKKPVSKYVPKDLSEDYKEACLVLEYSPKASSALSRRCLQHLLREYAKVKPSDLSNEIDEILSSGNLRTDLAEAIDAIRNIGNFSAHPMKSTNTGEIIPVEPGEAEWLLEVLDDLFDYYFVRPQLFKERKLELNKKLKESGKPEMKQDKRDLPPYNRSIS